MGLFDNFNPSQFFEQYGWFLFIAFVIYYFYGRTIKEKLMNNNFTNFTNNNNRNNSNLNIPPQNDLRLAEMRAKQQQRLNKITQIHLEKRKHEKKDDDEKKEIKLSAKQQKIKDGVAYRFATTGSWSKKDDDDSSGGKYDGDVTRYRPPSAFQRYGRRPGGGGG